MHRQLGHPSSTALIKVLKAGGALPDVIGLVDQVCSKCQTCKAVSRPMQRLVASLPKGRHFWDLLRGDLLHLEDDFYLCHFVDDATRLSVGGIMRGKSPEDVIEVLMDTVLTRPSAPRRILFDNGGEFINEKVQEVLEGYGVEICSTPSHAPCNKSFPCGLHVLLPTALGLP